MRLLIWGKTYPELSTTYKETVCTGGCTENGTPIRLYPVPFRYLPDLGQYKLYDWVDVPLVKSPNDGRPESYRVEGNLVRISGVGTDFGWQNRAKIIFSDTSWQFECLEELKQAEAHDKTSLGIIPVRAVDRVWIKKRPASDREHHQERLDGMLAQTDLFGEVAKALEFQPYRIHIEWYCRGDKCPGHTAGILDWGVAELARKQGRQAALAKATEICDVEKYDLWFFVGNFKAHPKNFGILGLWYPKRSESALVQAQKPLF